MIETPIFLSLLVTVILAHFTLNISLKKEMDDFLISVKKSSKSAEFYRKILNRKKIRKRAWIFFFIIYAFLIVLYKWTFFVSVFNNISETKNNINIFSEINNFSPRFLPFKKGFFSEFKFMFSYIIGVICSIIILFLCSIYLSLYETIKKLPKIMIFLLISYGLIWFNNFISLFLSSHIKSFYVVLSLIVNIIIYIIVGVISFCINVFLYIIAESKKKKK